MSFTDKVMTPFTPVEVEKVDGKIKVSVIGRTYTIDNGEFFSSIVANGEELLASPMRVVGTEDGEEIVWKVRRTIIQSHTNERAIIVSALESKMFDLNISYEFNYDGLVNCKLRIMTTSYNMAQRLRLEPWPTWKYQLEKLWIEVPMIKEKTSLYSQYPRSDIYQNGEVLYKNAAVRASGDIPEGNIHLPFKALFWVGEDERGLGFVCENGKNRQPIDWKHHVELEENGDERIVRYRLLDSQPVTWDDPRHDATYFFRPLSFDIGIMATPVRPAPKTPFIHNAIQILVNDNVKELAQPIEGYDNHFDFLKSLGITTLVLHETWNLVQNYPCLDQETEASFAWLVKEAHKREMKVMPYFGYEISSLSPTFENDFEKFRTKPRDYFMDATWWRNPPQRDFAVCQNSEYSDFLAEGIQKLNEKYPFDGLYLDGTIYPRGCVNAEHGCGWTDPYGNIQATYPIMGARKLLQKLYSIFEPTGGIINYHSATLNFVAMPYTHMGWTGESIQVDLIREGAGDFPIGFAKTEWTGRNLGVAMEMIAYPNPPKWTIDHATGLGLVHCIIPRPFYPRMNWENVKYLAKIRKAIDKFPFEKADFFPYWRKNDIVASNEQVKCTYYVYEGINGKKQILLFCSNLSTKEALNVAIPLDGYEMKVLNTNAKVNDDGSFDFGMYQCAIISFTER